MTLISHLKSLNPKLYDKIIKLESELYLEFEDKQNKLTKVKDLILKGDQRKAAELFKEVKKKPEHIGPGS